MPAAQMNPSWLQSQEASDRSEAQDSGKEPIRLWRSFLTARVVLGLVLVALHGGILMQAVSRQTLVNTTLSGLYFLVCLAARVWFKPKPLSRHLDGVWALTIGIDVLIFTAMQTIPGSGINYAPLFALPVLMAAILGSNRMGLGTSALITLALFTGEAWYGASTPMVLTEELLQASLTGAGCFLIAFVSNQFASKWVSSERNAETARRDALIQQQVNALVVENLGEGIVVADKQGAVRLINLAARQLIGLDRNFPTTALGLDHRLGWQPLMTLLQTSFEAHQPQSAEFDLHENGQLLGRLFVETQVTAATEDATSRLCVMVLRDTWKLRSRIQTEKLVSMGRMSAALAHEIRNPLAAIVQANELLHEDLHDPAARKLTAIVRQNANRLERIVGDVLDLAQAPQPENASASHPLELEAFVLATCQEWQAQHGLEWQLVSPASIGSRAFVQFDTDHLRRILVNLLDNAWRYASHEPSCIQVSIAQARSTASGLIELHVWSDGTPITPAIEQHLFEPFFSSQNRSTGLGLYICRELCQRNHATIGFRHGSPIGSGNAWGKDFFVSFAVTRSKPAVAAEQSHRA